MIEIFKTNITNQEQAGGVYDALARLLPGARISFDLDDPEKILRVEDDIIDADQVMETVKDLPFPLGWRENGLWRRTYKIYLSRVLAMAGMLLSL